MMKNIEMTRDKISADAEKKAKGGKDDRGAGVNKIEFANKICKKLETGSFIDGIIKECGFKLFKKDF